MRINKSLDGFGIAQCDVSKLCGRKDINAENKTLGVMLIAEVDESI